MSEPRISVRLLAGEALIGALAQYEVMRGLPPGMTAVAYDPYGDRTVMDEFGDPEPSMPAGWPNDEIRHECDEDCWAMCVARPGAARVAEGVTMDFERDQDGDAERFVNWEKRRDTLAAADAYERFMRALAAKALAEVTDTVRQFERGEIVDVLALEASAAKLAATIDVAQRQRDINRRQIAA